MPSTELEALVETRAGLDFRPATLADARLYAALTAAYRPDPSVTAHAWANPMLHINEELGYQRIPGILSFRKQR
jgi:hypothetical protein